MYTDTSQESNLKQSFVDLINLAWMWNSYMQCLNRNQRRECIMGDCLCFFASDFLSHTFETSEPHSYLVLPLGHISESGFNIFCFSGVTGSQCVPSVSLGGRKMVIKDSPVTWGQTHWGPGRHTLTPFYVNPDMLLLILIRQIKLARRLR